MGRSAFNGSCSENSIMTSSKRPSNNNHARTTQRMSDRYPAPTSSQAVDLIDDCLKYTYAYCV
jgi:hypothetical protein